jgi:hypothetical protein
VGRYVFRRAGVTVRIKMQYATGRYANLYRATRANGAVGWQLPKPEDFEEIPYIGGIDPFARGRANEQIYWPEDEKDCDTLGRLRLPAFTFGGTADGLPDGCEGCVSGRDVVILANNHRRGQEHALAKAALAHRVARSVKVLAFPDLPRGGDVSDWFLIHGVSELKTCVAEAPEWHPGASELPSRTHIVNASDLRSKTFAPVKFVIPNLIAEGVTLLASRPKQGKSWMALDICLAAAADRLTLGAIKPRQGDVLYLALEDSERRLKRRIEKLLPADSWPRRLKLATQWRRLDRGGLDDLAAWCRSVANPVLICVDTLAKVRPQHNGKMTSHEADDAVIHELHALAIDYGVAIVLVHHDRRIAAQDRFDGVSGTLGLIAAADTVLLIKRGPTGITLHAKGRDIEDSEIAIQFDKTTCRWTALGDAAEVHRSNERSRVVAALREAGGALSIKEIMVRAELSNRNAVGVMLWKMVRSGEIRRARKGQYGLAASGKIGNKDIFNGYAIEMATETERLADITDITGRSATLTS